MYDNLKISKTITIPELEYLFYLTMFCWLYWI